MKKIIINLVIISLAFTQNIFSQQGWFHLQTQCSFDLRTVTIFNPEVYFAAGDLDTLLLSEDKGFTWNKINIPNCFNIKDIKIINDSAAFLLNNNSLYKSTDKGINWSNVSLSYNHFENRNIDFINELTGYICGGDDSPYSFASKTTDGGFSWSNQNFDVGDAVGIKFFNRYEGSFLVCNKLYYTTDGGATWSFNTAIPISSYVKHSVDPQTHFIGGSLGKIYKTTNNGSYWSELETGSDRNIQSIYFVNKLYGFAVGDQGLIIKSTDGGSSWIKQVSNTTVNLTNICFLDYEIGLITREGGVILKTITGGDIILNVENEQHIPESYYLGNNYPNPFNPVTKIKFDLPKNSHAKLFIYDALGREVAILVNDQLQAGQYTIEWNASGYPSGIYFYKLTTGDFSELKKMILVK